MNYIYLSLGYDMSLVEGIAANKAAHVELVGYREIIELAGQKRRAVAKYDDDPDVASQESPLPPTRISAPFVHGDDAEDSNHWRETTPSFAIRPDGHIELLCKCTASRAARPEASPMHAAALVACRHPLRRREAVQGLALRPPPQRVDWLSGEWLRLLDLDDQRRACERYLDRQR